MKKVSLFFVLLSLAFASYAQNYEPIKNLLVLGQYKKAKEDLDKGMTNAKFAAKPEAYILKTLVYASLAGDETVKNTPEAKTLITEAETAFAKYKEMQPDLSLVKDPVYQSAPINLYSSLFSVGYKDYNEKNWQHGFETFEKVVALSDMLIKEKLINVAVDTNSLLLAGITAESSNNKDAAAKYYSRLADIKVADREYENFYRFLVNYYFTKKDLASFEKYKALGKEVYPKSEFFNYDKVDFAVGLETELDKKIQAVEEIIASDPTNYKAALLLGGVIYDTLNSTEEGAVQPANAAELETKMVASLNKAASLSPNEEDPHVYLGGHYLNKAKMVNKQRSAHAADMQTRTKPGKPAAKEDIQKREDLDKLYAATMDLAIAPYEKAAAILGAKLATLNLRHKQQYKFIVSDLGEMYGFKKIMAKGKPAEAAKFAAEEKKWNDLYDSIH
jgi:hypothetical protein